MRARFADGMRHALHADLDAARAEGARAVTLFWITTIVDICRFGLAERREGFFMRGMFTVDWRDAWRSLRAAPLVTAFAVVSLALGIGGVTALFSILNSLALKPLPVRDPGRLVIFARLVDQSDLGGRPRSAADRSPRTRSPGATSGSICRRPRPPTWSTGLFASGGMFDVLGVRPRSAAPSRPPTTCAAAAPTVPSP